MSAEALIQKRPAVRMKASLRLIPGSSSESPPPAALKILRLEKSFSVNDKVLTVLKDISFTAATGEMICILGPSGCGKSTLLKILSGFLPPDAGSVILNGKPVTKPGPDRCVVFQEEALFPWLTVAENIAFGLKGGFRGRKRAREEVDRFLELVGLAPFRDYRPSAISGGMKQRVALARVLILKPKVLLMDEPFAALDAQAREEMQRLLLDLWKTFSHTILFVTHDVSEAVTLADRILVMGKTPGCIQAEIRVNLSRPRRREDSDFHHFCRRLYERLRRP
ncbi:ABC transporter ATP-binding protein [Desulfococcus sp.]|uniref:ABC transporter ATP-binding protein n=1 Tax=Desulfococcus sp. TaxID=2025834 RepID=UPI003D0B3EA0